jgi:translation initiation factor IF-2
LAKGIRVNQLAKELNVESKAILAKLRDEGLGDKAPNHMSVLPLGLAESVREWFSSLHGHGTAVETAAPVEVAVAKKTTTRTRKKKADGTDATGAHDDHHDDDHHEEGDDGHETTTAVAEAPTAAPVIESRAAADVAKAEGEDRAAEAAPVTVAEEPAAPAAPVAPTVAAEVSAPVVPAAPGPVAPVAPLAPAATVEAPSTPQAKPTEPVTAPTPVAPPAAASAPAPVAPAKAPAAPVAPRAPGAPGAPGRHGMPQQPVSRPTITLANRNQQNAVAERKPVTPAPKLVVPEPAQMRGPKIIREEKPDHVPAPRPRRPIGGEGGGSAPPTFIQARAQGGRGVKTDEDEEEKKKAAKAKSLSSRRRDLDGRRGAAEEKLKEFSEQDLADRDARLAAASQSRAAFDSHLKKSEARGTHAQAMTAAQRGGAMEIEEPITVRSLSSALGVKTNDIMGKLMKQKVFATINQALDRDVAAMIALEYGVELVVAEEKSQEEILEQEFESREVNAEDLRPRPAVVTILGHVDHGKTSLLDKIRNANVAAGEAGGITQHTAAWTVEVGEGDARKRVTFIDTPGHQAFTSMRARGANMTDVVVLVVSAAEGVQPQTVESINHAKAAGVPLVVAMNKIDRPDANPDMVLGQLAGNGLNPVEWGGDTEVIRTSAVTGQGIPELIEILDYQSQLLDLKSDPSAPARGTVIESRMDEGLGSVATVLVQEGTLRVGDIVISGGGYGRIRSLINDRGVMIKEAGASTPVIVSGLNSLPNAGDKFYIVDDLERAREVSGERQMLARQQQLGSQTKVSLDNLFATMKAGDIKTINLIIKGDVQGSVETLAKTVTDQNTQEVRVRVIHSAVGPISESDVELADASDAVIIGFHVVPDDAARAMAEQRRVEVRLYRVIYEIFDDLKKALSGLLEPEIREKYHGRIEIRQVFKVSKIGNIAGCMVTDGHVQRGSKIRLIRDGRVITEDLTIDTLRRVKDDVKEVKQGFECGIKLAGYDDIKEGDTMEAYVRETIQRTL